MSSEFAIYRVFKSKEITNNKLKFEIRTNTSAPSDRPRSTMP